MKVTETQEYKRLNKQSDDWKRWGPYISNRQWGTVREQYTLGQPRKGWNRDEAWTSLSYDEANQTAYRWGEDGIFGISDDQQQLCFALALWNGRDDHIKERFFGLPGLFGGNDGSHGEDVKDYYFYLDNTPTHSYMKALYKYPSDDFPYRCLRERNDTSDKDLPEFDILDTGVFDSERYFDITVEYAKRDWNDIYIRIMVENCSPNETLTLYVLPQLWFRNTWQLEKPPGKEPKLTLEGSTHAGFAQVTAEYVEPQVDKNEKIALYCEEPQKVLFTDNETRPEITRNSKDKSQSPSEEDPKKHFFKDGISRYVCDHRCDHKTNFDQKANDSLVREDHGTKCAACYIIELVGGQKRSIRLRLTKILDDEMPFEGFDVLFDTRRQEADAFFDSIFWIGKTPTDADLIKKNHEIDVSDWKRVQRQAFAGLLWSKQFYHYNVSEWLDLRSTLGKCQESRGWKDVNSRWSNVDIGGIMLVPDKWEYPYFATWDSAFQAVAMALIDPRYAKDELLRFTDVTLMRYDGQMPGCEFGFDDVHPPIHAWAAWKVYEIEKALYGHPDEEFLKKIVPKLWTTFHWWQDHKQATKSGKNDDKDIVTKTHLYRGGFLGLDNISVLDRNQFDRDERGQVFIEQADAAGWMGLFSLMMLKIAIEVGDVNDHTYKTMAKEALDSFCETTKSINRVTDPNAVSEWNMHDYWYYDVLRIQLPSFAMEIPLRYRSIIGVIPLFATECLKAPKRSSKFMDYVLELSKKRINDSNLKGEERHAWKTPEQDRGGAEIWLTMVDRKKLFVMLDKIFDEQEFLAPYGIRSLSKKHHDEPYRLDGVLINEYGQPFPIEVKYEPGEAVGTKDNTGTIRHVFGGGNSNWRGPIWFPINFLIFEMLRKRHEQFATAAKDEQAIRRPFPVPSENRETMDEIAMDLGKRLVHLFCPDDKTKVIPAHGQGYRSRERFSKTSSSKEGLKCEAQAGWSDLILFYEYFDGDNGSGLGASHQTGWTALVANIIHDVMAMISHPVDPAKYK